jgi:hypothetical protein
MDINNYILLQRNPELLKTTNPLSSLSSLSSEYRKTPEFDDMLTCPENETLREWLFNEVEKINNTYDF